MQHALVRDGLKSLSDLITRLSGESRKNLCPEPYKEFLSELARNTPMCGLLQLGGNQAVCEVLHQLASTGLKIQDSGCHHELQLLQTHAPVLAEFICRYPKEDGELPCDVRALISQILLKIDKTFTGCANSHTDYLPIQPNLFSCTASSLWSWTLRR